MQSQSKQKEQPLAKTRTSTEWKTAVLELEASKTDSGEDVFAYWKEIGYHGKLAPEDVDHAAKVAKHLEILIAGPYNPFGDVRFLILGALTFAYARTNDVRKFHNEPPL